MTTVRRGALLGLLALPLACSTLADPEPASVCVSDDDCNKARGEICGAGTCYASNLPARAEIALDVSAVGAGGSFRLEVHGPDRAVDRIDTRPIRYQVGLDNRGEVPGARDELRLSVLETYRFGSEVAEVPLRATLTPSQSSRLGVTATKVLPPLRFDPLDADGKPLDPVPALSVPWAHYDSNDRSPFYSRPEPEPERPLIVTIAPDDGIDPISKIDVQRGVVYRQLVREQQATSGTHTFTLHTDRDCHRKLHGSALVVGEATSAPPVAIAVELVHARRDPADPICDPAPATGTPAVCSPATIARVRDYKPVPCTTKSQCPQLLGCYPGDDDDGGRVCGCERDSECQPGQVCELGSRRCALDLASPELGTGGLGLSATEAGVATTADKPEFEAWVYTYCEDDLEGDREMEFVVRANPSSPGGDVPPPLPPLNFHTSVDFVWQNGERPRAELKNMCFPDWSAPQPLAFDVSSAPQELYRGPNDQPYVCCSPACLDQGKPSPTAPAACRLAATITARTIFTPDKARWDEFSCMALDSADPSVPAGSQRITYSFDRNTCTGGACDIALSAGRDRLEYEIRVEPPAGSLIRSMVVPVPQVVEPTTTALVLPRLEYRVLLRGSVSVDPSECPRKPTDGSPAIDCPRASILVERLRVPDEEPALAPIFLTASTIAGSNGNFVVPVNPGVYLVTALPASGSPGGPADIRVVDLRLDSKLVDRSGPIPVADLGSPLALNVGRLVTVELEGFGRNSKAVPLDVGYWAEKPLTLGGKTLNLNDPETCHGSQNRGCAIRRLRLAGSVLSLTQESYVKYLARGMPESE